MSPELDSYLDDAFEKSRAKVVTENDLYNLAVDVPGVPIVWPKNDVMPGGSKDTGPWLQYLAKAKLQHARRGRTLKLQQPEPNDWIEEHTGAETPQEFMDRLLRKQAHYPYSRWAARNFIHLDRDDGGLGSDRVYISCSVDDVMGRAKIFEKIMQISNRYQQHNLKAKVAGPAENRLDCIVVWTDDTDDFVRQMLPFEQEHPDYFGPTPPRLCKQAEGSHAMGLAEEPRSSLGQSFNSVYKKLVKQAMDMDPSPPADKQKFKENVVKVLQRKCIDPCHHEQIGTPHPKGCRST